MKAKFSKEMIIGIVTIIGLTFLYIGVNYLKGINLFRPINHYYVTCANVSEVTISTPVFVGGFKVGLVRNIVYDYQSNKQITIEINLEKGMRINKGSYVTIERTFLSGAQLHIHLNTYVNEHLSPGSTIEGRMMGDLMGTLQSQVLPQFVDLMPKIDSILYGLNQLVNNPALTVALNNLDRTTANLATTSRTLNQLMETLEDDVPVIASNLKETTNNFVGISNDLKQLNLSQSVQTLNETLVQLQQTVTQLNSKDNSLGLLMNDTLLYDNLTRAVNSASDLLIDLKTNPKRYLHFSVF
ncbi:MAG: MlaD family protein [Tannerella sp.]|jgi:phospholipid/cholesterol/gamma-HCH transport system substrate-binding protein|nr:MlaD family protein [Tannerella sp.]